MSNPPPVEFHPGMEIVPGYTLITPLGSGMAGDVWQAQAAGGIKVALKVVRSLSDLGGRKELKALKTIRDVHHPNLCPLFGFWTKDAQGRVLADGETEDLTFDSISSVGVGHVPGPRPDVGGPGQDQNGQYGGTMAIGSESPLMHPESDQMPDLADLSRPADAAPKPKVTAEQLIVVMGLGDCTLYDRLKFVRQEAGLGADAGDVAYGLDPAETIRYLRASASAIDLLNQEHQIYHCDIKPQNILLVGGEAQVCDFGLAKQMEGDMRQTQHAFATPAYAPPEVLHNEGYSRQVDQYSLAVTYYELRTGLLPFDITTHASMLVAKSTGKLNLDALLPAERKVLQKALRRVPSERYSSCAEFVNAIAVASGVEKSGGIKLGKILAAAGVMLCLIGIGMGTWRYVDPSSFNAIVLRSSEQQQAELLKEAQATFEKTQSQSFERSEPMLTDLMERSVRMSNATKGAVKANAQQLFYDSAARLISRVHTTLQYAETQDSSVVEGETGKQLEHCLGLLEPGGSNSKSQVSKGLIDWSKSESAASKNQYEEFASLYHAATVRFDVLKKVASSQASLDALRRSLDERPQDFSAGMAGVSISPQLASLLPVLASTPSTGISEWKPERWLQDPMLTDLVRAEKSVRELKNTTVYSDRWSVIREKFTVAVEPVVIGNGGVQDSIDQAVRNRVLESFPDLQTERQLADLRLSVEELRWQDTDNLLKEIETSSLGAEQSVLVKTVAALAENRDQERPLESALRKINDTKLTPAQLRKSRTQSLFASYLKMLGTRAEGGAVDGVHNEFKYAVWTQNEIGVDVPADFSRHAAISLLRDQPRSVSDVAAMEKFGLSTLLEHLRNDGNSSAIWAAIHLQQQMAIEAPDQVAVADAMRALTDSAPDSLVNVSASYRNYLLACGNVLGGKGVETIDKQLMSAPRESVKQLGQDRLRDGIRMFVDAAIAASGVEGRDMDVFRYSKESPGQSDVRRAKSYLRLAEFLRSEGEIGSDDKLDQELLVLAASQGAKLSTVTIPQELGRQLSDLESTARLSNQVLKALHRIGLAKTDGLAASKRRNADVEQLVIRPASVLVSRFGPKNFGPRTGTSSSKRVLSRTVIVPTVRETVIGALEFDNDRLVPLGLKSGVSWNLEELAGFCRLASQSYSDDSVRSLYDDDSSHLEHRLALAAISLKGKQLDSGEREILLIRATRSLLGMDEAEGAALLAAADDLEKLGGSYTANHVRSEGYKRQAEDEESRQDRKANLMSMAFSEAESGLDAIGSDADGIDQTQERYELLAQAADLAVRLAFLKGRKSIDAKLELLIPASERAEEAISLYEKQWADEVICPIASTYIARGNALEDIAHYCSPGTTAEISEPRDRRFESAISAFKLAVAENAMDFKTRGALGRCQLRYAQTLDGSRREDQLDDASRSLGRAPERGLAQSEQDSYVLWTMADWFLWKLQVETELGNKTEASQLADSAFEFVRNENLPLEVGNDLSRQCAAVHIANGAWENAVDCLIYLRAKGPLRLVINRMGRVSDITFLKKTSRKRNDCAAHLSILSDANKEPILTDNDDEAYELAKIATRCVKDLVAGAIDDDLRQSDCVRAKLPIGIHAFAECLDRQGSGRYRELADLYVRFDQQTNKIDMDKDTVFRFACDLSALQKRLPDVPDYVAQKGYIRSSCCFIVFDALLYWRGQQIKLGETEQLNANRTASRYLTETSRADIVECLSEVAELSEKTGENYRASQAKGGIKIIDQLWDLKQ